MVVNAGEELRIVCTASGDPTPMVSWERLQGYMYVFLEYYLITYVSLKIYILRDLEICHLFTSLCFRPRQNPTPNAATYIEPSARKDMEGSYLCRAKNAAGETEDLVQVIVNENGDGGRSGKS